MCIKFASLPLEEEKYLVSATKINSDLVNVGFFPSQIGIF